MTVNITCSDCDGRRLCEACRNAARSLTAAGYLVEHSTRYAALRAAASGTYGFEACVMPVAAHEHAIVEAAMILLRGKRLAFIRDDTSGSLGGFPQAGTVLERQRYAAGDLPLHWLTAPLLALITASSTASLSTLAPGAQIKTSDETATLYGGAPLQVADGIRATRRLKRLADSARATVARAGLESAPRLDMVAVLEDEVAWARASGVGFGMVLVHLPGLAAAKPGEDMDRAESRLSSAAEIVSRAVRSSDVVAGHGDDFLVLLAEADEKGTQLAAQRISAEIASSSRRTGVKHRKGRGFAAWGIGCAAFPSDGAGRDALLAHATATLERIGEHK